MADIRYYDETCFELIVASELLTDSHRWINGISLVGRYVANPIFQVYTLPGGGDVYIIMTIYHGTITSTSKKVIIHSVNLDANPPEATVTLIASPDTQLLILKHEFEPAEEQ